METQLEEAEWVQAKFDQLKLIEEKRLTATCHGQLYQRRMKRAFDKKVRPREFHEGDLVLKKIGLNNGLVLVFVRFFQFGPNIHQFYSIWSFSLTPLK